MSDRKPTPRPSLRWWKGERKHGDTTRGWKRHFSTPFAIELNRDSDPELGLGSGPNKAAEAPSEYPSIAASLKSDEHPMVFRRFARWQLHLLLHQQDELVHLERELNDLDVRDSRTRGSDKPRQYDQSQKHSSQSMLLQQMEEKLSAYSEHIRDNGGTC